MKASASILNSNMPALGLMTKAIQFPVASLLPPCRRRSWRIRGKQFGADEALAINLLENTIALSATDPQFAHLTQSTDGRQEDDACLMAAWKEQFVAARTKLDKTKDSSIRAFSRVTNRLKANKTIEFEGKWVWFTD